MTNRLSTWLDVPVPTDTGNGTALYHRPPPLQKKPRFKTKLQEIIDMFGDQGGKIGDFPL